MFVNIGREQSFASALRPLTIALVFSDIRDQTMIETYFSSLFGVQGTVGIEISPLKVEAKAFDGLERGW